MTQKTILITGCSSGIGHDAAHGLAARGWRVFATCRQPDDCARLQGEGLESFPLDLAQEDSIAAGVEETLSRLGGAPDALFNNGAFALPGLAQDVPRAGLRSLFETNLFGQIDLTNRLLPAMQDRGAGRIVMNSSILGFVGARARAAYVSSKFALEGYTDVYRLENRHPNIHFVLIEPGPVTSSIRAKAIPHFERWIDWEKSRNRRFYETQLMPRLYNATGPKDSFELPASAVTRKLVHALESPRPKLRYYVTTPTYMAGAMKRVLPTRLIDRVLRKF
ncbi:SDR family NAD(P)-dependent oxidoreductase [Oceanibium sediminis]|uniref:SDR family NAD(P)-dependent oxidoreductase n=1 Tax=Oceanibium sediminis TaxID=2026339 RepID=UPI000DD3D844|nr:SDR family NAD(P)-dependent oxidoreductase [Oceanibium sediminis]